MAGLQQKENHLTEPELPQSLGRWEENVQNPPVLECTSLRATQLCKGTAFAHLVFSVSC